MVSRSLAILLFAVCTCSLLAAPVLGASVAIDDVRAPNFVYSTEKNNICVSVSNNGKDEMTVTVTVRFVSEGGMPKSLKRSFVARSRREDSILLPFDMSEFPKRAGRIEVTVKSGEDEIGTRRISVRDSLRGLKGIEAKLGLLYDSSGARCMICTVLEDPAEYRKWAAFKWAKQRADRSPKRVLLLGSIMSNTLDKKEGPYVGILRRLVEKSEESFDFVARGTGLRPVFEDMLKAGSYVSEHRAQIFIYCPGLEDLYNGVPVREFSRALDVMIDQVRSREEPPRIILVTPVLMFSDMKLSKEYESAMRKVAKEHHTDIVDLREVFGGKSRSIVRYYSEDDDARVYHLYPLDEGQELLARAIARRVY